MDFVIEGKSLHGNISTAPLGSKAAHSLMNEDFDANNFVQDHIDSPNTLP